MKPGKKTLFIAIGAAAVLAVTAVGIHQLMSGQQKKITASKAPPPATNLLKASINNVQTNKARPGTGQPLLRISTNQLQQCKGDISLSEKALLSLPQQSFKTKHSWSENAEIFSGPLLKDVLNLACQNTSQLMLRAINDYTVKMDFNEIRQYKPIVALSVNHQRLSIRNKGPLWIMMPIDEFQDPPSNLNEKMIWQLSDISILSTNEPK